jgi:diaminopimelate decarboxylase
VSGPSGTFAYGADGLAVDGVPLSTIAAVHGTPTYVYAADAMRARYRALAAALAGLDVTICYAVKANHNLAVIATLAREGAGADTVSIGEVERALAAGVPPGRIVLAGVAKTDEEIARAIALGLLQVNVESAEELERVAALAAARGRRVPVALRVNPDIGAGGHDKISTGRKGDKFGVPIALAHEVLTRALRLPGVEPVGLHVHIGSQITGLAAFEAAYGRLAGLWRELRAAGVPLRRLDLGGGLGVRYGEDPAVDPDAYAQVVRRAVGDLGAALVLEPGRWLVAEAGALLARVVYLKSGDGRRFAILDAGMNTLVRPAMYGARHAILPVAGPPGRDAVDDAALVDVVGPICESSDVFGRDYRLPGLAAGDLVALMAAGAYGAVMASDYNSRPAPAEVLVDRGRVALVRTRRDVRAQMAGEHIPDWLAGATAAFGPPPAEPPRP